MKRLVTICGVCVFCISIRAHAALPTLSGLADSLTNLQSRYAETTNTLNEMRARLAQSTNIIALLVAAIDANRELREAFHGGKIGTYYYAVTNGISPSGQPRVNKILIDLYADHTVHTNASVVKVLGLTDPEAAAKMKVEMEARRLEIQRAWEAANLPRDLAAIREAQRQAAQTQEVMVVITP